MTDQYQIGGDGAVERYHDPYGLVTEDQVKRAHELETEILQQINQVEVSYLRIAKSLSTFKREKLYLARNFTSFQQWADSEELSKLSYRSAQRLVQIADDALPLLVKHDLMEMLPSVSALGDLLPLLNDDDGETKFVQAIKDIQGLTNKDIKALVKERRGLADPLDKEQPAIFSAQVERGTEYHRVQIFCSDGVDYYKVTPQPLMVKPKHFARFEERFGRFLQMKDV